MSGAVNVKCHPSAIELRDVGATVENNTWSCRSGEGINWMKSTGIPNIEYRLDKNSSLIILMGVNGRDPEPYVSYINEKLPEWNKKGVKVYFVSVMPTDGKYKYMNNLK